MVSALAFTTIRFPTLLNGIIQEVESLARVVIETDGDFEIEVLSAAFAKQTVKMQRQKRKQFLLSCTLFIHSAN
ncbi:MAG TPA: hypothetical protein VL095_10780 [Flavisolibacter sp.]|nr:hypothetical protein [Flavisolibacter sp.]